MLRQVLNGINGMLHSGDGAVAQIFCLLHHILAEGLEFCLPICLPHLERALAGTIWRLERSQGIVGAVSNLQDQGDEGCSSVMFTVVAMSAVPFFTESATAVARPQKSKAPLASASFCCLCLSRKFFFTA